MFTRTELLEKIVKLTVGHKHITREEVISEVILDKILNGNSFFIKTSDVFETSISGLS